MLVVVGACIAVGMFVAIGIIVAIEHGGSVDI